ncbi:alpha amylase N-terminal ig-like domain-containing protein [Candidatus Dependentiae bacterium]|nr:alpha amylase N-terminal ig-like domain-containing protein [Candidatus Dependentiae bacterium]
MSFEKKIRFYYNQKNDSRIEKGIDIKKVSVAGTFNNWNQNADLMIKTDSGYFEKYIKIPEGMHYYKLVLNDIIWIEDLNADTKLRKDDGMGYNNYNSGLNVKETGADYGVPKKNEILVNAIAHNDSEKYFKILSPGKIKITLRIIKENSDYIKICFMDGVTLKTEILQFEFSENGFDFHTAEIKLNSNDSYFDYWFELKYGDAEARYPFDSYKKFSAFTGVLSNIPEWAKKAVWYQIFPERFYNSNKNNDPALKDIDEGEIPDWKISKWTSDWYSMDKWETEKYGDVFKSVFRRRYGGDLQGIIDKLDYLKELGINAIYLNPIFRSPSLHKYDGSSFHHIDEHFGPDPEGDKKLIESANETEDPSTWVWTSADNLFLKLIKETHIRGMKIIIDGVFNHSGRLFFGFQDILKNKQKSKYINWYSINNWDDAISDGFEYIGWFGHKSLPEFYRNESGFYIGYENYVFNITKRWMAPENKIENGIDGWRLDVAFCVPHNFWKKWRKHVKSINPEAYITAEVIDPAPEFLRGDEFDAVMNYPFTTAVIQYFVDKKFKITASDFNKKLEKLRKLYPSKINYILQNLMSSHDTARLRSVIVNPDLNYSDWSGYFNKSKLENNPEYRIDRGNENDIATHKLIVVFQMTYIGAPMIYYGDETGMTGANDPDCRKPMLWEEFDYENETIHPHKNKSRIPEKNCIDKDLLNHYKKLIKIRKENIELQCGTYETVITDDKHDLFGFIRIYEDSAVLVIFNAGYELNNAVININKIYPEFKNRQIIELLNEKKYFAENGLLKVSIPKREAVILKFAE